jgi:hypothetical protein
LGNQDEILGRQTVHITRANPDLSRGFIFNCCHLIFLCGHRGHAERKAAEIGEHGSIFLPINFGLSSVTRFVDVGSCWIPGYLWDGF